MLQKIGLRRCIAFRRHDENRKSVIERSAWTKVAMIFAGLQDAPIARLVARHADVVGEPGRELCRIHDRMAAGIGRWSRHLHFHYVRFAWTVAIFAADGQLLKRRVEEAAVAIHDGARHAAMARDARRQNRTIESVIAELIAGG